MGNFECNWCVKKKTFPASKPDIQKYTKNKSAINIKKRYFTENLDFRFQAFK